MTFVMRCKKCKKFVVMSCGVCGVPEYLLDRLCECKGKTDLEEIRVEEWCK